MKRKHIGSNFDEFLKREGLLAKCEANARKRIAAKKVSTPRRKER